ncbi:hypothetical protein DFH27DRAFT_525896 [Peziza echinospora]|nr:hypothetical protein DFH27DRAFT_525896 [Peziza echinospora]
MEDGGRYTVTVTIHSASHLPPADFPSFTSDPYVLASIHYPVPGDADPARDAQNNDSVKHVVRPDDLYPPVMFRSTTKRQTLNPAWGGEDGSRWVVANVPHYPQPQRRGSRVTVEGKRKDTGVKLRVELWDEDEGARDDRLGGVILSLDRFIADYRRARAEAGGGAEEQQLGDSGQNAKDSTDTDKPQPKIFRYKLSKRHAGRKGYLLRMLLPARLTNKIAGDTEDEDDGIEHDDGQEAPDSPSVCLSVEVEEFRIPEGYTLKDDHPHQGEDGEASKDKEKPLKMFDRPYTVGPQSFSQHFSPLLGHITGTKSKTPPPPRQFHSHPQFDKLIEPFKHRKKARPTNVETYLFAGTQIRLPGPVPAELVHPYIAFKPFVLQYFSKKGIKGRILRRGLQRQFKVVYGWDSRTIFGTIDTSSPHERADVVSSGEGDRRMGMAKTFLEMIEWAGHSQQNRGKGSGKAKEDDKSKDDPNHSSKEESSAKEDTKSDHNKSTKSSKHADEKKSTNTTPNNTSSQPRRARGKIYTYVLTLDSLLRFTPTGPEFGINFLSKHSMHSNLSRVIAFSGEFYVTYHPPATEPDHHGHANLHRLHSGEKDHHHHHHHHDQDPPQTDGSSNSHHHISRLSTGAPHKHIHPPRDPHKDPRNYILHIDNNSGTYRPKKELLPVLKEYLMRCFSVGSEDGLRDIDVNDCFDKAAEDRKEEFRKGKTEGEAEEEEEEEEAVLYMQRTGSSSSMSSVESNLARREADMLRQVQTE